MIHFSFIFLTPFIDLSQLLLPHEASINIALEIQYFFHIQLKYNTAIRFYVIFLLSSIFILIFQLSLNHFHMLKTPHLHQILNIILPSLYKSQLIIFLSISSCHFFDLYFIIHMNYQKRLIINLQHHLYVISDRNIYLSLKELLIKIVCFHMIWPNQLLFDKNMQLLHNLLDLHN